jgi:hypothetical protein
VYMFSIMYSNFSGSTLKLKSHIYSAEYLAWPHIIIGAYEHTWPTGSCAILTSLCIQSVVFFIFFYFSDTPPNLVIFWNQTWWECLLDHPSWSLSDFLISG